MMFRHRMSQHGSLEDRVNRRVVLRGAGILAIDAFLESHGVYRVLAQEATPATGLAGVYPEVEIIAADFTFAMPDSAPAGLTRVAMRNDGHVGHHAMFLRLNDNAEFADLEAALTQPDVGQALALSQSLGGPVVDPGLEASVLVDLQPGQYMVICAIPEPDGTPHYMLGMLAPFEVTETASDAAPPEAAVTIEMVDFAYEMPEMAIAAGPQIWAAPNVGEQIHEMAIVHLAPARRSSRSRPSSAWTAQLRPPILAPLPRPRR